MHIMYRELLWTSLAEGKRKAPVIPNEAKRSEESWFCRRQDSSPLFVRLGITGLLFLPSAICRLPSHVSRLPSHGFNSQL